MMSAWLGEPDKADLVAAFGRAIDLLPYGVVACDQYGNLTFGNRLIVRMLGSLQVGLPASSWPASYGLGDETGTRYVETGQIPLIKALERGTVTGATMYQRGADQQVRLLAYTQRVRDRGGTIAGAVGVFVPISGVPAASGKAVLSAGTTSGPMSLDFPQLVSVIDLAELMVSAPAPGDIRRRVIELVSARLADEIRLGEIAESMSLSPAYPTTLTRRATGRPLMGLVRDLRMREARRLLGATALPISAVSRLTGPWNPASFARSFRDFHGCTSTEWRVRHANQSPDKNWESYD